MLEDKLIKYRGNYSNTNKAFVFQNFPDYANSNLGVYESVFKVVKNILLRGGITLMSEYLQNNIGLIHKDPDFKRQIALISNELPQWRNTIKGDAENNFNPALDFFYKCIPNDLSDYAFIQQLIIPEAQINIITNKYNKEFINQRVDFFLPQARLVIEIDGQQHKADEVNRISDKRRDQYLATQNIFTVRIDTKDLINRSEKYYNKINLIKNQLNNYSHWLSIYSNRQNDFNQYEQKCLKATAIFRFQILLLDLLLSEKISLNQKKWTFNISMDDFEDKSFPMLAIEDLFLWIESVLKLAKQDFNKPKYIINWFSLEECRYSRGSISIDFSLFKRWSENSISDVIFVRTDYYGNHNEFKISCANPINYKLILDGVDSDIPTLHFFLKNIFGFETFTEGQLSIICNSLQRETTIGILPTGSGKSLCYQFVAMLQPGITIVVCPIKALMYDQKENLDLKFITNSMYISGDMTPEDRERVQENFGQGRYQFLWISPERFQSKSFRDYLNGINNRYLIVNAVIDEVHCLSEWGHDFRISYLNLVKTINKYCPKATMIGLTATASPFVLEDIKIEFNTETKNIKTLKSFNRAELNFHIVKATDMKDNKIEVLYSILNELSQTKNIFSETDVFEKNAGLIFTQNVNGDVGCYDLANKISNKIGREVKWFSGSVPTKKIYKDRKLISSSPILNSIDFVKYKEDVQKDFKKDKFPLLVATKAFGMGIDKSNIRYTIHYGIPGSLESLYQEAGRAGRDRNQADCYIIYTPHDSILKDSDFLFEVDTSISQIKEFVNQSTEKNDMMSIFYLFQTGLEDLETDLNQMVKIYNYLKLGSSNKIIVNRLGINLKIAQKAVYRLSLLGVLSDWTIEDWDVDQGVIEVTANDFNDQIIFEALNLYIKKYEPSFDINATEYLEKYYPEFVNILEDENTDALKKAGSMLILWNNENIVYNRRQSIKNIIDLCNNYKDGDKFKAEIERYFKFSDKQFLLDEIAHNPTSVNNWLSVFFDDSLKGTDALIDNQKVLDLDSTLARLLESYRYNEGLNWIVGLVKIIIGDYNHVNGKSRLISSFDRVRQYNYNDRETVIDNTLKIAKYYLDDSKKTILSETLCDFFPEHVVKINAVLNDEYSLRIGLEQGVNRLKSIGDNIL